MKSELWAESWACRRRSCLVTLFQASSPLRKTPSLPVPLLNVAGVADVESSDNAAAVTCDHFSPRWFF